MNARDCKIEVYVRGDVWWSGGRMSPAASYHCVFSGSALDYSNSSDLSVSDGSCLEELDWDDIYFWHKGQRYRSLDKLPCSWDETDVECYEGPDDEDE